MIIIPILVFILITVIFFFMRQSKFGKMPTGERLEKIKNSPNYKDGSFHNQSKTPNLSEGANYISVMAEFIFGKKVRVKPVDKILSMKTDLLNLDINKDILVWFGHSSYFMQIDKKKILVDPVLSGTASPVSFTTKAFEGSDVYKADDIPEIDYFFITHDHWDHLDYETMIKLKPKIKKVICGLGVGEHLEHWGFDNFILSELDWSEKINLEKDFTVQAVAARHFSGRGFKRNQTLWTSFVLQTPAMKIFIGGDSGYDKHFIEIVKSFGNFDLVILENGQYDKSWKYIHMMPEEVLQAATDLNAKQLLTVHNSKFAIANHPWDEPLIRIHELSKNANVKLITPMIGEEVNLKENSQKFSEWWKKVN